MPKLIIRPSNLAFRFHVNDGWDAKKVSNYFWKCTVKMPHPDDKDPYFVTDFMQDAVPDKAKMLAECEIQHCWFWSESENARTQEQIIDSYYPPIKGRKVCQKESTKNKSENPLNLKS